MADIKHHASPQLCATLIGDVVGSRAVPDRRRLHRLLTEALEYGSPTARQPPALTVGDEFQATYPDLGAAIDAALTIRLALAPTVDIRFGLGWGQVTILDSDSGIQDGPGWWAAREAIGWVATAQTQPGLAHIRTAYRAQAPQAPAPDAVNAALWCRDHLLGSLDERSLRILTGLRQGRSKKELAVAEGISASAVSQRAVRDGLDLIVLAAQHLRDLR